MPQKLSHLRLIGRVEGISFLTLIIVAMPLKYWAGRPEFVKWTGWAHGILFVLYLTLAITSWWRHQWPVVRLILLGVASLIPFGPFLIDNYICKWEQRCKPRPNTLSRQAPI